MLGLPVPGRARRAVIRAAAAPRGAGGKGGQAAAQAHQHASVLVRVEQSRSWRRRDAREAEGPQPPWRSSAPFPRRVPPNRPPFSPRATAQVEASLPAGSYFGAVASGGGRGGGAEGWTQLRLAHLLEDPTPSGGAGGEAAPVAAGLFVAAPHGPGFEARFAHLTAWRGRI
jgi:hypothetical protein